MDKHPNISRATKNIIKGMPIPEALEKFSTVKQVSEASVPTDPKVKGIVIKDCQAYMPPDYLTKDGKDALKPNWKDALMNQRLSIDGEDYRITAANVTVTALTLKSEFAGDFATTLTLKELQQMDADHIGAHSVEMMNQYGTDFPEKMYYFEFNGTLTSDYDETLTFDEADHKFLEPILMKAFKQSYYSSGFWSDNGYTILIEGTEIYSEGGLW